MAKTPGFAVIAIVTMALVVGATTAVFSVAEAFSFVPLRYLEPQRLFCLWRRDVLQKCRSRSVRLSPS